MIELKDILLENFAIESVNLISFLCGRDYAHIVTQPANLVGGGGKCSVASLRRTPRF